LSIEYKKTFSNTILFLRFVFIENPQPESISTFRILNFSTHEMLFNIPGEYSSSLFVKTLPIPGNFRFLIQSKNKTGTPGPDFKKQIQDPAFYCCTWRRGKNNDFGERSQSEIPVE
jgi:hypothetical protein